MRRFLSWITLAACEWLFALVMWYFSRGAVYVFYFLQSKIGGLVWLAIVLEGSVLLGFAFTGLLLGTKLVVSASQAVWKSKAGARYMLYGIITSLLMGAILVLVIKGLVRGGDLASLCVYCAIMFLFGLFLIGVGKDAVKSDGLPPTKKERLEAKLAAIEEKERRRNGQDS